MRPVVHTIFAFIVFSMILCGISYGSTRTADCDAACFYQLGREYADKGDCKNTVEVLEQKARRNPQDAEAAYELAMTFERDELFENARKCLERMIARWPQFVPAYKSLGIISESRGDCIQGMDYLRRGYAIDTSNTRMLYTYRRLSFARQYFYSKAKGYLRQCIENDNRYVDAYILLAKIGLEEYMYDQSILNIRKAVAIRPCDAALYYELGILYHEKSMGDMAVGAFLKAISLGYRDADIYYRLGMSYYDFQNDYANAMLYLRKALAIDASLDMARLVLALSYVQRGAMAEALEQRQILDHAGKSKLVRSFDRFLALKPRPASLSFMDLQ